MPIIKYKPSTSHWLFPPIIMGILAILLAVILVLRFIRTRREGKPFLDLKGARFFVPDWDKVRFIGTLVLFVLYILSMQKIGFLPSSIVFIFLFNVLFAGVGQLRQLIPAARKGKLFSSAAFKSVSVSLVSSIVFSVGVWYLFARVFNVTLP